jgi:hypothetical protein
MFVDLREKKKGHHLDEFLSFPLSQTDAEVV